MKFLSLITLFLLASGLFAAPLESGYSLAPRSSASNEEKTNAYIRARLTVIEESKKYLGTPYKYGGMSTSGMDCSGFICVTFKEALGVSLPRSASGLYTWTEQILLEKAQPGDFLFFRTGSNRNITHVGLYLGERRFIHAASSGSNTGVIYSSLNEEYWRKTYAGAGRAFPEAPADFNPANYKSIEENSPAAKDEIDYNDSSGSTRRKHRKPERTPEKGRLIMGASAAPIWNGFVKGSPIIRGISSNLYFYIGADIHGRRNIFGLEIRPEYDAVFGIFNLPLTLSWGLGDRFRIFAGPLFSFGNAVIETQEGKRYYSGKTKVLGTIGVTVAPFPIRTSIGNFSPYAEFAWQSYFSDNREKNLAADFSAGFRISTGIRWLMQLK